MARNIDLRELIPEGDLDTITFRDGKTFKVPKVGVTEMGRLLMLEQELGEADTFLQMARTNQKLVELIREANPGKKVPDYDLTVEEIMEVIAVFAGAESAGAAVREALAREGTTDPTDRDAQDEAQRLAEAAGTTEEGDDPPLASPKRSRPRSSRSARSGSGAPNGGTTAAGTSSKRTSTTRSKSKSA